MNTTVKLLIFLSLLAGFTSCTRDYIDNEAPYVPDGFIRASLDLQVETPDSIQTRATAAEEEAYDDSHVWVLMFNATSASDGTPTTLVQAPVKAIKSGSQLYVLLRATTQPVTVYVVAGLSSDLNTDMGTASNFTEGFTTFTDVNNLLQTAAITAAGIPIGSGSYFPMVSDPAFYSTGTIPLTSITRPLTRNVAKINVDASAVVSDFVLEGVTLVNGAQKGFVFPPAGVTPNYGGTVRYNEKTSVSGNSLTSEIYLYENTGFLSNGTTPNPTKLIIKGKYNGGDTGYYRMDILKNNGNGSYTPYDIQRNYCYTLKIEKIENGGYRTFDEALSNEPSNTWYEVVVNDPDSYDIVSNGHYYLGVSNSEFLVYGDPGQIENLHIATVTTDAPAGTYTSITSSSDLSAVTSSLTTPTGTATVTDIYATLTAATDGYIDLRVGNLTKRITVKRGASIVYENSEKADFIAPEYVSGEVVSGTEWVRLSATSNAAFDLCPPSLIHPNGGIYVRYNSTLPMNTSRSAELYVSKTNDKGRAKMLLFATSVDYVSNTLPSTIDKDGKDINGTSTFSVTFTNPGNYPISTGITVQNSATVLTETTASTNTVQNINLSVANVIAGSSTNLPRNLSLKYKVNGVWFDTGSIFQQRTFFEVRILSVASSALFLEDSNGTKDFGTQLGTSLPSSTHSSGIGKMFRLHTGPGTPIENTFKLYNLSAGASTTANGPALYNNIGKTLRDNDIDILFCSINDGNGLKAGPDATQAQEIIAWLDENPYRGMIYITDFTDNEEISKALFDIAHSQASGGGSNAYSILPPTDNYYNNSVYKAIMCGSYSTDPNLHPANPIDLRTTSFQNTPTGNAYGGVPLANTNAKGFIPAFYVTINNSEFVLFAVHPTRNIIMLGDINWFDSRTNLQFLNPDGSLNPSAYGNYPKMVMNMWEWYINSVALGRGQ